MELVNKESLTAAYPELIEELQGEAYNRGFSDGEAKSKSEYAKAIADAMIEGAQGERDRIRDVKNQLLAGYESTIDGLMFDGKSTGQEAAAIIIEREREIRARGFDQYKAEGADLAKIPVSGADGALNIMTRDEYDKLPAHEQAKFVKSGGKVTDK